MRPMKLRLLAGMASLFAALGAQMPAQWIPPEMRPRKRIGGTKMYPQYSRSRYWPHQGARECERRRIGGFHTLRKRESVGKLYSVGDDGNPKLIGDVTRVDIKLQK